MPCRLLLSDHNLVAYRLQWSIRTAILDEWLNILLDLSCRVCLLIFNSHAWISMRSRLLCTFRRHDLHIMPSWFFMCNNHSKPSCLHHEPSILRFSWSHILHNMPSWIQMSFNYYKPDCLHQRILLSVG
jgi:hypothetical protein